MQQCDILAIGAHPDDVEIGCGGTLAKMIKAQFSCQLLVVTSGEAGGHGVEPAELAKVREEEAVKASKVLGAKDIHFCRYPDGLTGYTHEMKLQIIRFIRELRPKYVFTHSAYDHFPDHKVVNELTLSAITAASGPWYPQVDLPPHSVPNIFGYEVWNPINKFQQVVDISDYMDLKLKALGCHVSQIKKIDYTQAVIGLGNYRGVMAGGSKYAEVFDVIKVSSALV